MVWCTVHVLCFRFCIALAPYSAGFFLVLSGGTACLLFEGTVEYLHRVVAYHVGYLFEGHCCRVAGPGRQYGDGFTYAVLVYVAEE